MISRQFLRLMRHRSFNVTCKSSVSGVTLSKEFNESRNKLTAVDLLQREHPLIVLDQWRKNAHGLNPQQIEQSLKKALSEAELFSGPVHERVIIPVIDTVLSVTNAPETQAAVIQLINRVPFKHLSLISSYAQQQKHDWLVEAVKESMSLLIPSINARSDLVTAYIYQKMGLLTEPACQALEAKTVDSINTVPGKSLVKILHLMAVMKKRSPNVIGAIVYALYKKPVVLSTSQLANLFFACATLSIVSEKMLSTLLVVCNKNIISMLKSDTANQEKALNMIVSMGKMQWNNPSLLEDLCSCIQNPEELPSQQYCALLSTCAVLGFLPPCLKSSIPKQVKKASQTSVQCYLDIVWLLSVLGVNVKSVYQDLFLESTVEKLVKAPVQHVISYNAGKLLNIAVAAYLEFKLDFSDQLKPLQQMNPTTIAKQTNFHIKLGEMLLECLKCNGDELESNIWYPYGHFIDFRFLYDRGSKQVVSCSHYNAPLEKKSEKLSTTENHIWVAVIANSYSEMTISLNSARPVIGRKRLAENQLRQLGYSVLAMNELEFLADPDKERKLQWLNDKLQKVLN